MRKGWNRGKDEGRRGRRETVGAAKIGVLIY